VPKLECWRLFLALWPPGAVRERLLAERDAVDGRRVAAQNLHITLLFLGAVDASRVPALRAALAQVRGTAFQVVLDRREVSRQRVAWLGMSEVSAPLQSLHQQVSTACAALGFALERRGFRPHLTLARQVGRRPTQPIEPIGWRCDRFALVRSVPEAAGPRYSTLAQWLLDAT
jgi:RNA 2',3'-cyclic 3'-phosphodiesterase